MICDIISSLTIVVSLFRLHTCQLTLNMLFFIKIPGSLYSIINGFILTNTIAISTCKIHAPFQSVLFFSLNVRCFKFILS